MKTHLVSFLLLNSASAQKKTYDLVIVGAGAAGLSAGKTYSNFPQKSFKILEANNRPGGRIFTTTQLNYSVDLGPSSVYAKNNDNSATNIHLQLDAYGIQYNSQPFQIVGGGASQGKQQCIDNSIQKISSAEVLFKQSGEADKELTQSVSTYLQSANFDKTTKWCVGLALEWIASFWGTDSKKLSSLYSPTPIWSDTTLVFSANNSGYSKLVSSWIQDSPADTIVYNQTVTEISYNTTLNSVTVKTADGTSYLALQVIVAVPLGVLQAGSITFNPPLPQSQQAAIAALGNTNTAKLFLECLVSTSFQPQSYGKLFFAPPPLSTLPSGPFSFQFLDLSYLQANLTGISVDVSGEFLKSFKNDTALAEAIFAKFQLLYSGLTSLNDYIVKRWDTDPYSLGSGFYPAVGTTAGTQSAAGTNLASTVYFAGEYLDPINPGTVYGAYDSGVKAATQANAYVGKVKNGGTQNQRSGDKRRLVVGILSLVMGLIVST